MRERKCFSTIASSLSEYIETHGFEGIDPRLFWYFPGSKLHDRKPNKITNFIRRTEVAVYRFLPGLIKPYLRVCGIPSVVSPYGLGVLIQANIKLYKVFDDDLYVKRAKEYGHHLEGMLTSTESGNLGVPNPLEDPHVVNLPAGSEVAFAFLDLYELTDNMHYLEIAQKIANSFVMDFNIKQVAAGELALDYTNANDGTHIINANSLAMAVMVRIATLTRCQKYDLIIAGIMQYITKYLAWKYIPYAGLEDKDNNSNWSTYDCYHTGFTLRGAHIALDYCKDNEKNKLLRRLLQESLESYRKNFLRSDNYIKVYPSRRVIDIHGVAEYIRTISLLGIGENDIEIFKKNVLYMYKDGTFYYQRGWRDVFLYMPRWGHAPMMLAIAELLIANENDN